jgi:hypothetical protein
MAAPEMFATRRLWTTRFMIAPKMSATRLRHVHDRGIPGLEKGETWGTPGPKA